MMDKETKRHYWVWCDMRARCENERHHAYKNYGGRGISVCDEWRNSFNAFMLDMGYRPTSSHTIDRVDNNNGYCKENCRWSDRHTQAINRRTFRNSPIGIKGITPRGNGYRVRIRRNKIIIFDKQFIDLSKAVNARDEALKHYG